MNTKGIVRHISRISDHDKAANEMLLKSIESLIEKYLESENLKKFQRENEIQTLKFQLTFTELFLKLSREENERLKKQLEELKGSKAA